MILPVIAGLIAAFYYVPGVASAPWPFFKATTLLGNSVDSDILVGHPTLLIVTPSREAAEATREWVKALREKIDQDQYFVRDVLAVDLPFFLSEEDAIKRAKDVVPKRYHEIFYLFGMLNSRPSHRLIGLSFQLVVFSISFIMLYCIVIRPVVFLDIDIQFGFWCD